MSTARSSVRPHVATSGSRAARCSNSSDRRSARRRGLTGVDTTLETWSSTYDDDQHHRRTGELLDLVGCGGHSGQELATLSEGERKRVLVGHASS